MPLRFTTAGESHGPGLTAVVEGLPAGLELTPEDIDRDLARRQLGHGRGGRMKIEKDRAEVTSGVRHGRTLGSPIALRMANRDYANWEERMNPWPVEGEVEEVHLPRPGHADLAGRPEVRLHRRAQRARARQRARDRRARGRRARWPRSSCARSAWRSAQPRASRSARCSAPEPRRPRRWRTSTAWTSRPCAASTTRPSAGDGRRRSTRARKANESLGGVYEVIAFGAGARASARTSPGTSAWTAAWRRRSCRSRR